MDMGEYGGRSHDENGIGDPAVLVDRNTNTIWVAGLWLSGHKGERNWNASEPGMAPEKTGQFILVKSEDDGVTWSDPINITQQIKKPEWQLFFNGPGSGITMKDGTLVFAAQFKDKDRIPHSTLIYSKDGGQTWKVGTGAKSETTEAQVVELSDGSLLLNMRDDRNRADRNDSLNGRSVAITKDLGKTWAEHPTSRKALQASNCMASIIAYNHPEKGNILFFSNPNTKVNRDHITIKTSFDEGQTWPKENQLELYEENTYGYSCLTIVDENHIGILYEGNKELYFEKINIKDLIGI
jgi:sialidase-1